MLLADRDQPPGDRALDRRERDQRAQPRAQAGERAHRQAIGSSTAAPIATRPQAISSGMGAAVDARS